MNENKSIMQSCFGRDKSRHSREWALEKAAQAWCKPTTSHLVMQSELAEAFAEIIDELTSQPWLGNATTGELLDELRARCEVNGTINYKTVENNE